MSRLDRDRTLVSCSLAAIAPRSQGEIGGLRACAESRMRGSNFKSQRRNLSINFFY